MLLTPLGVVNRGILRTVACAAEEIEAIRIDANGGGETVRIVLIGRGSRQPAVGYGLGRSPTRVLDELTAWLARVRAT